MSFLSQLLPGIRHIRAPLVSGYIWLFAVWLWFSDELPERHESEAYSHAFELGETLGPVGLAAVVSIAAYLLGSLVQIGMAALGELLLKLERTRFRRTWHTVVGSPVTIADLEGPSLFAPADAAWFEGDRRTRESLKDLVNSKLGPSRERLVGVVTAAQRTAGVVLMGGGHATNVASVDIVLKSELVKGKPVVGAVAVRGPDGRATARNLKDQPALPVFSAALDLFGELGSIKTLLMENTKHSGSEIERLYAEAELRFAIAFPLAAVLITLCAQTSSAVWGVLVLVPLGLLVHAMVLNKHGGREMVEALRQREDLSSITPVFDRYEAQAENLAAEIEKLDWEDIAKEWCSRWGGAAVVSSSPG